MAALVYGGGQQQQLARVGRRCAERGCDNAVRKDFDVAQGVGGAAATVATATVASKLYEKVQGCQSGLFVGTSSSKHEHGLA